VITSEYINLIQMHFYIGRRNPDHIINFYLMLAVDSEHIPSPMQHTAEEYQDEPSLSEVEAAPLKQQEKRKYLTPINILIILAALTLIGLGSYYLIAQSSPKDIQSKINESHDKIISYADSSS
jgi:hypothetical protein